MPTYGSAQLGFDCPDSWAGDHMGSPLRFLLGFGARRAHQIVLVRYDLMLVTPIIQHGELYSSVSPAAFCCVVVCTRTGFAVTD